MNSLCDPQPGQFWKDKLDLDEVPSTDAWGFKWAALATEDEYHDVYRSSILEERLWQECKDELREHMEFANRMLELHLGEAHLCWEHRTSCGVSVS